MKLSQKVAVVTGGSKGLGRCIALDLAEREVRVVLVARDQALLQQAAETLQNRNLPAWIFPADVRHRTEVLSLFEFVDREVGQVDILVNCAGLGMFGAVETLTEEQLDRLLDTNLKGTIYCCQEAYTRMKSVGRGHIVNVASSAGHIGRPNEAAYAASKFGVIGFTESLAAEAERYGISVTAFSPGGMKTSFWSLTDLPKTFETYLEAEKVAKLLVDAIVDTEGLSVQLIKVARLSHA